MRCIRVRIQGPRTGLKRLGPLPSAVCRPAQAHAVSLTRLDSNPGQFRSSFASRARCASERITSSAFAAMFADLSAKSIPTRKMCPLSLVVDGEWVCGTKDETVASPMSSGLR